MLVDVYAFIFTQTRQYTQVLILHNLFSTMGMEADCIRRNDRGHLVLAEVVSEEVFFTQHI